MSSSRLSPRVSSLGRFLFGAMLALLVVDLGLRLIEVTPLWRILPVVQPILGQPDKDFGFESTPGGRGIWTTEHRARLQLNSLGLRDVERDLAKPAGTFRIGLLGDSMVEAAQVSQQATFGAIAERRLRADGYNIELINLAIAGPNPIRQLWRLERRGYPLNLDLVIANSAASASTGNVSKVRPAAVAFGRFKLTMSSMSAVMASARTSRYEESAYSCGKIQ